MPYNRKAFSGDYATETFYFPLSVQVEDEDSEDLYDVTSGSVRWFEDEIQAAIDDYQSDIEMERYLCDDNDAIQRKLISAEWGVETLNGELYGRMKRHIVSVFKIIQELLSPVPGEETPPDFAMVKVFSTDTTVPPISKSILSVCVPAERVFRYSGISVRIKLPRSVVY